MSVHVLENISHSSHLSSSHNFPHFQCFTCKNVLIRYKSQNSRYFSFLLPYSFALKNMLFKSIFLFYFLFVDPESVSICSYMCWASIMSKYLASMIWGSTLFLNTEQTECMSVVTIRKTINVSDLIGHNLSLPFYNDPRTRAQINSAVVTVTEYKHSSVFQRGVDSFWKIYLVLLLNWTVLYAEKLLSFSLLSLIEK